jgi:sulfide:quinone oxidoreductase
VSAPLRVLILGAGFGGLELSTRLSEEVADDVVVTLVDRGDTFVFGFSKLDVMFGRRRAEEVRHAYGDVVKPSVTFRQENITSIDPEHKRVVTEGGTYEADVLVVALGADLHPEATPGLVEGAHEFYTVAGAFALREVLAGFAGGHVVVGVTSTPFKCPPAPSETALLVHEFLTGRGIRDRSEISLVMPFAVPIPPSPQASEELLGAFAARDIRWCPQSLVRSIDPARKVAELAEGDDIAFDLFLGVPVHKAPPVVEEAGLCVDGWIPVDPRTLETAFPDVYAVGDVTSVGTPKAGVFAEGQAAVVAQAIMSRRAGDEPSAAYGGRGQCYLEFGHGMVAAVDVTFAAGQPPTGTFEGPSLALSEQKAEFGRTRIRRWFGREWLAT